MYIYRTKNSYKLLTYLLSCATAAITVYCCSADAKRIAGPNTTIQFKLDALHQSLSAFKEDCGRYPLTKEGLEALLVAPDNLHCKEKSHWNINPRWLHTPVSDPWKQVIQYTSDGESYRIQASHGYFVTDKSPKQIYYYWEHIGPAPIDPEPHKNPGMAD